MPNKKKTEESKKQKLSISMNDKLLKKLDEFLDQEELGKRSKYIEKLIREDMEKKGKDVSKDF
jgi:metal-responsive CopG/Arc/MetJ family transcriptional regulator